MNSTQLKLVQNNTKATTRMFNIVAGDHTSKIPTLLR